MTSSLEQSVRNAFQYLVTDLDIEYGVELDRVFTEKHIKRMIDVIERQLKAYEEMK